MQEKLRSIPSMDKSLHALLQADKVLGQAPKTLIKDLVNSFWNMKREEIRNGHCEIMPDLDSQLPELLNYVREGLRPGLRPVINGTGVIIHTNLGRSILAEQACEAVSMAARSYCNLEMDLANGERGSRHALTGELVRMLTGAEDSLIVNNNAAAVLLALDSLCAGGETIVSRGELVEIGGSFRIPDIMRKSGAVLKEVGTTNRTHPEDYEAAINEQTKAIMHVHASNFRISGFHSAVGLAKLACLAHENGLPLICDLGSGYLLDCSASGIPREPTVSEVLAQGADLVCFSGDKALGGPQAGIIAGKKTLVEKLKRNPLTRALRCDKLCLAALEATLRLYLDPNLAIKAVPSQAMMHMSAEELAKSARLLAAGLRRSFARAGISCRLSLRKAYSRVGGGSFPECELPTTLICLQPENMTAQELRLNLLDAEIPVIGRLEKDAFCLDPRTLSRNDFRELQRILTRILSDNK